ncbi:MAG: carboxylating nicotinate-nucleotide diphosphorylase [Bacteroidia bacterium]|nr:carboxylating nicotinate-nucleotide diphosphorylase [Bacteroidia bacterium]
MASYVAPAENEALAAHPETLRIIRAALSEDIGPGDYTSLSTIPAGHTATARCLIKEPCVLAGVAAARMVFAEVDPALQMEPLMEDGAEARPGDIAFYVTGDPRSILQAERVCLNILQRMSGVATLTREVVRRLEGTACRVLDTRKTTPLFRHMEKWAVRIGGGVNHRMGLYDMVMIKDNHTDFAGGIQAAMQACKTYLQAHGLSLPIEVEARTLGEVQEIIAAGGADRILLDNMTPDLLKTCVTYIAGRAETEASGGIGLEQVREVALTGVTYLSMGALTHSYRSMDISLKAIRR